MAGYLDHYGEGYEKGARRKKLVVIAVVAVVSVVSGLYFGLRNYRQKAKVEEFVELLRKHDYTGAYRMWGCTDAKPCRDYPLNRFMEDWGPQSANAQIPSFHITKSRSCGTGVIVMVNLGPNRDEKFWVEGSEMTIGFSPWSVCPPSR